MNIDDEADFVIIGTGAGGATAARVLASAGCSVVMLEEGPHLTREERPKDLLRAMRAAVRSFGTQATVGSTPIPLLQGRLVGGSTAINSGIIWRMPEDVRRQWIDEHGLAELVEARAMENIYERIEAELEVAETGREVFGGNNERMAAAAEALGLPGKPMTRNARHCRGRARCLQGCPTEARQSMDVSYVPRAIADGARLHAMCRVDRIVVSRRRAVAVTGHVRERGTNRKVGRFEVRARRGVILACGVLHTPLLLLRLGLRGLVGERFQAHPGCAVVGRFPEPIRMSEGATQGYEVPMRDRGFKLETLSLPPEMLATRLPGAGAAWQERLAELDHYAQWCVQIRMMAHGRVRRMPFSNGPLITFEPTERDVAVGHEAIVLLCRMMFAVGATEVYPGVGHLPETIHDVRELDAVAQTAPRRGDFHFVASHLFGTACAGSDPARSVVGDDLRVHGIEGLHVMDASVFPTNMGVNPQHSIMAVVWRAAEMLANAGRVAKAA